MHRLAQTTDLEAVHRIYMHDEVVPFLGVEPMPLAEFQPVFGDLLAGGGFHVVEQGGAVKGFYRVQRHAGRARHTAYLGTLAVSPDAKGTGFAAAMMIEAIDLLAAEGVLRVELMLEADNPRAMAFYRKLGFEYEGTLRAAYKRAAQAHYVDEVLMARLLVPLPRVTPA